MRLTNRLAAACAASLVLAACSGGDPDATVAFTEPADGATVHGAVDLAMTADGIKIMAAGEVRDGSGHFHVIADDGCLDPGSAIGKDADHVHFGSGGSQGVIYLDPGGHELCLQVGDGVHSALDVTDTVSITVAIRDQDEWCAVMDELDQLIESLELTDQRFADQQIGWEGAGRLAAQLLDGIDHVDEDASDDVAAAMELAADMARAVSDATDADGAERAIDAVFESVASLDELPGQRWIETTCGIDLED